jgi:hypothetical protein
VGARPTPPRRHEGGLSGDGLRHGRALPGQPGGAGQGGWNVFFTLIDRSTRPPILLAILRYAQRARGLGWLADERAHRPCARRGWTPPDTRKNAADRIRYTRKNAADRIRSAGSLQSGIIIALARPGPRHSSRRREADACRPQGAGGAICGQRPADHSGHPGGRP